MPIAPQVPNNPVDVANNANITAATKTGTQIVFTIDANPGFAVGDVIWVQGFDSVNSSDYNGQFTIAAVSTSTVTVASTTTQSSGTLTDLPSMIAIGASGSTDYDTDNIAQVYAADTEDLAVVNVNAASALSAAQQAQADAATAISNANTAIANAATAQTAATNAAFAAGQAQTTANGKNTVHYSTSGPSGGGTNGDVWFQLNGSQQVVAQYTLQGGTWVSNPITSTVIASIDAGKITAGTISSIAINNGSGTFSVTPSGALVASSAIITGQITATSGTFTGTVYASAGTFTGTVTATSGSFTGSIYAYAGYIGDPTTGWNFSSSGYMYSNDFGTILYPKSSLSPYALITNRGIDCNTLQIDSTSSNSLNMSGGIVSNGYSTLDRLQIVTYMNIVGGYGINSHWSPNSDNTYNLGISGSYRWSHVYANNTTITTSDERKKTDVTVSPLGLDFINSLRPVSYKWIVGSNELVLDVEGNPIIESYDSLGKPVFKMNAVPGKRVHYGLIAQEVKSALDAANVGDFAGWVLDDMSDPDSTQSLSYEQFISPLIKAVQELTARVNTLEGK